MNYDLQSIAEGDIDLYEFLGISSDATDSQIRSQYRRKALIFHPDKEGGDVEQFRLLSQIYEILSNEDLKEKYDSIREIRIKKDERVGKLDELTRKFRVELERAEKEFKETKYELYGNDIIGKRRVREYEKLQEEGIRRRRALEASVIKSKGESKAVSTSTVKDLPTKTYFSFDTQRSICLVRIKWKVKPGLQGIITPDILVEILSIFGEVNSCTLKGKSSKYETAEVEFKDNSSALKAVQHNYRESASLWDGTKVRKLASLLRECTFVDEDSYKDQRGREGLSQTEKIEKVLKALTANS